MASASACAGAAMSEFSHDKQPEPGGDERLARLQAENARLRAELRALREQVQQLQRRLGLDSSNSGKPPSSDGPAKPPAEKRTRSQRGRSGKPSGGQRGHPGTTLSQSETPDRILSHLPESCAQCGAELSADDIAGASPAAASAGLRFAPAAGLGGNRTSGARLPLRGLWQRDAGCVPGRRQRPGAVR